MMIRHGEHASRTRVLAGYAAAVTLLAAGLAVVGFADPSLLKTVAEGTMATNRRDLRLTIVDTLSQERSR